MNKEEWIGVAKLFGFLIGVLAGLFMLANWGSKVSCKSASRAMHLHASYGFFQGCIVEIEPNVYRDINNLNSFNLETHAGQK